MRREDCRCSKCSEESPVIGYDPWEELVLEPARFWVRGVKREKRGSHCLEEQGVVTATAPGQIVPKSKLSTEFIVEVMFRKFKQHDPIYRQLAALEEDQGIQIDRKTVNSSILAAGELLVPALSAQARELKSGGYLQADETPVPCQTREKTRKNLRSYIWEYNVPAGPAVFGLQIGRSRAGPEKFLKG